MTDHCGRKMLKGNVAIYATLYRTGSRRTFLNRKCPDYNMTGRLSNAIYRQIDRQTERERERAKDTGERLKGREAKRYRDRESW